MLVQLDRMKKEYDGFSLELNMEIPENQVTGLIGANGAGKSTTFKLMLGLIRPDEGNVEIFGRNAAEMGAEDKQKIGAAFSDSGFSDSGIVTERPHEHRGKVEQQSPYQYEHRRHYAHSEANRRGHEHHSCGLRHREI